MSRWFSFFYSICFSFFLSQYLSNRLWASTIRSGCQSILLCIFYLIKFAFLLGRTDTAWCWWKRVRKKIWFQATTNQVTMRRMSEAKYVDTKTGYGKGFEYIFVGWKCVFFCSRIHLRRWCMNCSCNVWSFAACINHVYNHKSNAVCLHETVESRLSFRWHKSTKIVLLSHIFSFDFIFSSSISFSSSSVFFPL